MNTVLTVTNRHVASCGEAPDLTDDQSGYTSYFEGLSGDQWVYTVRDGVESLYGGDIQWDEPWSGAGGGLGMDPSERLWLHACRLASGMSK